MSFRVYKPKGLDRVKAVQVTKDNMESLAELLMGRVSNLDLVARGDKAVKGIDFPTLEGNKHAAMGFWIIRKDGNAFEIMDDSKFQESYEVARNTN